VVYCIRISYFPAIASAIPVRQQIGCSRMPRKSPVKAVPLSEAKDDWFEYRLENDPRFLQRIEKARRSLRAGRSVRLEDI